MTLPHQLEERHEGGDNSEGDASHAYPVTEICAPLIPTGEEAELLSARPSSPKTSTNSATTTAHPDSWNSQDLDLNPNIGVWNDAKIDDFPFSVYKSNPAVDTNNLTIHRMTTSTAFAWICTLLQIPYPGSPTHPVPPYACLTFSVTPIVSSGLPSTYHPSPYQQLIPH